MADIGGKYRIADWVSKLILGQMQRKEAKKIEGTLPGMEAEQRLAYEGVRDYEDRALGVAESLASQREIPGQSLYENKLATQTGAGMGNIMDVAGSSAAALGGVASLYGQEQNALTDLGIAGAQFYAGNQAQLQDALGRKREQEKEYWYLQKYAPYLEAKQKAEALRNAYLTNAVNSWGSAEAGVEQFFQDWYGAKFGNWGGMVANMGGGGGSGMGGNTGASPIIDTGINSGGGHSMSPSQYTLMDENFWG